MSLPVLMIPHFRSGRETPWAGDALHRFYEKYTLGNQIGESYDFSTIPGYESTSPDGTPLSAITASPFLIKWVDAKEATSIHIHPQYDEYLIIIHAESDASIVCGFMDSVPFDFPECILNANSEDSFRTTAVKVGDIIRIPSGVPHSLKGITAYQIQKNDIGYFRIFDWNRTNARGQKRALQIEKAFPYISTALAETLPNSSNSAALLHTSDFTVLELNDCENAPITLHQPFSVLTCLSSAKLDSATGRSLYLCAGQTLFIPSNCNDFCITGKRFFLTSPNA